MANESSLDAKHYGIKHATTGKWFGGFRADQTVKWVDERAAMPMDQEYAFSQIHLLQCAGTEVQRRFAALGE